MLSFFKHTTWLLLPYMGSLTGGKVFSNYLWTKPNKEKFKNSGNTQQDKLPNIHYDVSNR